MNESRGFFASLFDLDFRSFVTLRFIKVIYVVAMVVIAVLALVFWIALLAGPSPAVLKVLSIVFVPVGALVYLVLARIYLELVAVLFRIGDNTSRLVDQLGTGGTPPGGPSARPGGWSGPTG